jgi:hypothetical protein
VREILGPTLDHLDPTAEIEAGDGCPQPGGPPELTVEEDGPDVRPLEGQDQSGDACAAPEIEEGRGLQGRCPDPGMDDVTLDRFGAEQPDPSGVAEDLFERRPGHADQAGWITT